MSTSRCGKICITLNYYSRCSIVAAAGAMSWRRCFVVKVKVLCLGNTTRNQWLSCIYNTVPEQFNPNIRVCAAHFKEDYFLNLGVACQLCSKAVSIKWSNSNFARTAWRFWLTACKYVSATDDSNVSFEQCRVVLVVCRFSDHKCRHGHVYAARCNTTRKKTV